MTAGVALVDQNFTDTLNSKTGSVSGVVTTSSGAGIPNITIYLDANNNGVDAGELFTTTNASGAYDFNSVPAGALIVRQILPSGDTQTSPANGYGIHITMAGWSRW